MKRSLAVLMGVGVLTFALVQCKTSHSDSKAPASKPTSSSAAPAPVVSTPAEAAQATIDAANTYINSPDPCLGLDASTCSTLKDAATQTAAADPNALAQNLTAQNLTDASNTITPPVDTTVASNTNTSTNSETSVSTNTHTSNNTGAKVAVGLGVPLLVIGAVVALGVTVKAYSKWHEEYMKIAVKKHAGVTPNIAVVSTNGKSTMHISNYRYGDKPATKAQITAYENAVNKEFRAKSTNLKTAVIVALANAPWLAGLASMAYGASVLNSSAGLAEGTTDPTPAQTLANTLNSIGQAVVNGYQH